MIAFELGVEDLADTRFAASPLAETVFGLWTLSDPGRQPLHLPWLRSVRPRIASLDIPLLLSLVGESRALPDFLTPRPASFAPGIDEELATVRATDPQVVRRDLIATHRPGSLPEPLAAARGSADGPVAALRDEICDLLASYWKAAVKPAWPQMRLVLEADMTYRAGRLATGGARRLFADLHPNLAWRDGTLYIDQMIGRHRVSASGRGLLLIPSVFAYKPVPPLSPDEPPWIAYPSRGVATLWAPAPEPDATALVSLLGATRARLLDMLGEPLPTIEMARRLGVTPSAVSQHLRVLHAAGLLTRVRHGRHVLYRRGRLANELAGRARG
jgi:DNA-binding transcriptional ArsR family regulator